MLGNGDFKSHGILHVHKHTHTHKYTVQHRHQKKNEKEFKESGQENRINSRRIEDEIIIIKNADHIYK